MQQQQLIQAINKDLSIQIMDTDSFEKMQDDLALYITELVKTNFQKLLSILYRIDVSETKLKFLLQQNNDDAGKIIANAIIERQIEKIKLRQQFSKANNKNISDEELW